MNKHQGRVMPTDNRRNPSQYNIHSRVTPLPQHNNQQSSQSTVKEIHKSSTPFHTHRPPQRQSNVLSTCRICLQQSPCLHANNQNQLRELLQKLKKESQGEQGKYVINMCKCQGTSGYVHQRCVLKWIEEQRKRGQERQVRCEICLEEILYERRIIGYFQFTTKKFSSISPCNIFCLALTLLVLAASITLITQSQQLGINDLVKITIIIFILLLSVGLGLTIVVVVKEAFYRRKIVMGRVLTNDEIQIAGIRRHSKNQETSPSTQINQLRVGTFSSTRNIHSGRDELIVQSRQWQMRNNNWSVEPSQLSSPYESNNYRESMVGRTVSSSAGVNMIRVQILSRQPLIQ